MKSSPETGDWRPEARGELVPVPGLKSQVSGLRSQVSGQRGGVTVYLAVLLTFMLFALLVMAVDVGRLYMVQGELQTATDAAALAAATQLTGNSCADTNATLLFYASFDWQQGTTDSGAPNDNRFNLGLNHVIDTSSNVASTASPPDYCYQLLDAQQLRGVGNCAQAGANARYAKIQVSADMPTLFTRFLSLSQLPTTTVVATSIAGVSTAVCTACAIDPIAVTALDASDPLNYGFLPGQYYTLYLSVTQRPVRAGCTVRVPAAPLTDTIGVAEYTILYHYPSVGYAADVDGQTFELGAAPMTMTIPPDADPQIPGCVSIDATEQLNPAFSTTSTCAVATQLARDFLCGLNVRFPNVDPATNACGASVPGITDLTALYKPDGDPYLGSDLQDYSTQYCGNQRRVLTVALIDDPAVLTVLNFRQFLIESDFTTAAGLNVAGTGTAPLYTGAFRAQYIGYPAPIASGAVGGACIANHPEGVFGPGRPVLYGVAPTQ